MNDFEEDYKIPLSFGLMQNKTEYAFDMLKENLRIIEEFKSNTGSDYYRGQLHVMNIYVSSFTKRLKDVCDDLY